MPKNDKYPHKSEVKFFENGMNGHNRVKSISSIKDFFYLIEREGLLPIKTVISSIYIVSEADIFEIIEEFKEVQCIVLPGSWNSYTSYAKLIANQQNIGLFTFKEFYGALNFEGQKFLDYKPPTRPKKRQGNV